MNDNIMTSEVIEIHISYLFIEKSTFFRYLFYLIKIWYECYMYITKMQIFHKMESDLIITLTYVLMDNFCPCFKVYLVSGRHKEA